MFEISSIWVLREMIGNFVNIGILSGYVLLQQKRKYI